MAEQGGSQLFKLLAVEGALVLADDDRVETACRVRQGVEQPCRLRPVRPGHSAGDALVEKLDHDLAMNGDQVAGVVALPPARRRPILEVDGEHPSVKREAQSIRSRGEPLWP
ncbi:hypothetical protein ABZ777_19560 [Micromonospora parva]|uniref:hypothetical protein n=1 Tax=Micromonospora parva TaxID=1464048 RepID=UPI0033DD754D